MALSYNPKDAATCWPEGEYEAVLKRVENKISKSSGQDMEVWTFEAFDGNRRQFITEYVTAASVFKIKQLAQALRRKDEFDAGTFQAEEVIGSNVRVLLVVEEQSGYDDKNRVKKIFPAGVAEPKFEGAASRPAGNIRDARPVRVPATSPVGDDAQFKDSDIPF